MFATRRTASTLAAAFARQRRPVLTTTTSLIRHRPMRQLGPYKAIRAYASPANHDTTKSTTPLPDLDLGNNPKQAVNPEAAFNLEICIDEKVEERLLERWFDLMDMYKNISVGREDLIKNVESLTKTTEDILKTTEDILAKMEELLVELNKILKWVKATLWLCGLLVCNALYDLYKCSPESDWKGMLFSTTPLGFL